MNWASKLLGRRFKDPQPDLNQRAELEKTKQRAKKVMDRADALIEDYRQMDQALARRGKVEHR